MTNTENIEFAEAPGFPRSRVVIDTSIFVNPDTQKLFGPTASESVDGFLDICRKIPVEIFLPTSIFKELSNFVAPQTLKTLRARAIVRAPDLYNIHVPAAIFHTFIHELRLRVNKGLHIAEQAIKAADLPENVQWVRQHYREALRSGIIDSVEDLEVVFMAREINGVILTSDKGIANLAGSLGIEVFSASEFRDYCNTRETEKGG